MGHINDVLSSPGSLTIHKAITVLRAFSPNTPTMSLRQVVEKTNIPKSTAFRLLAALQADNLIEQDCSTGNYQLGFEVVALAGYLLGGLDVRNVALPYMRQLAEHWNETVCLDVLRGVDIIIAEQIPGQHFLRTGGTFAARQPAHCTSTGKVLLAYAGRNYVETNLPKELKSFTAKTITSRDRLLDELSLVRQQGYAIADGEYGEMVTACAAPIHNRRGEVIAAISVSGPNIRIDGNNIEEIINELKQVTMKVSCNLGYVDEGN